MLSKLPFTVVAATGLLLAAAAQAQQSKGKDAPDPNKKICESITPVGSRLATKRVCATRAEWADKRRQDREETEKAQRLSCLTQSVCGGN
jgi:hypothetical protein